MHRPINSTMRFHAAQTLAPRASRLPARGAGHEMRRSVGGNVVGVGEKIYGKLETWGIISYADNHWVNSRDTLSTIDIYRCIITYNMYVYIYIHTETYVCVCVYGNITANRVKVIKK